MTSVLQTAALLPDLSITTSPGATVPVGSTSNITLRIDNVGTAAASNVTMTTTLSPGVVVDPTWVPPSGEHQQEPARADCL